MSAEDQARLEGELATAEADVTRLRAENGKLADAFRAEPTDSGKEQMTRAAASLAAARDRMGTAKGALAVFLKTGSLHGLVADNGKVTGTIAVTVKAGSTREERETAVEVALTEQLNAIADELGVVLAAKPSNFTKERPGRDAEGRTVLEVAGRVEGGRLVPAVSKAAKHMRS
jgi:hypothetical protein